MIDILIIAEGTYPYIRGGVSTWIDEMLNGFKDLKFGLIFLGGKREDYEEIQYKFPENLIYYFEIFLFEDMESKHFKLSKKGKNFIENLRNLHLWFKRQIFTNESFSFESKKLSFYLEMLDRDYFLYSKESWEFIVEMYNNFALYTPFIDYFWNVRNMHLPIFSLASLIPKVPEFKIIHSPSTGYAGFLASLLSIKRKKPLIITEHGIYTIERKIDILNIDIFQDRRFFLYRTLGNSEHIRKIWIEFFMNLGKFSYDTANFIISLFEDARKIQISYGADPKKCRVIPNGIDIQKFLTLLNKRPQKIPKIIALIGRVVPIKDVKTFIKAIKIASSEAPEIEGWVIGPTEEDPDYYEDCLKLVEALNLENKLKFMGFIETEKILSQVGLVTLTSVSEGMPLVILEALASGVPCVTTDVGSCRQILYGGIDEEDLRIGKAGEVVPVANPEKLAQSYLKLLYNENLWKEYQKNGLERIKRYYTKEKMFQNYRNLYMEALEIGRDRV